ncbi:MAG: hypothetical protein IPP73_08685 [Chitinophagaceae bacterium]|nr:hypothetical protein [Chitinophagaceae bacterium]
MKKLLILLTLVIHSTCFSQSQEAKQLLLNVEKLAQLKLMLSHMKTGYQILEKGYTSIKIFLRAISTCTRISWTDCYRSVSVKQYSKVADIIRVQLKLVKESKAALAEFRGTKQFTITEIEYLEMYMPTC